MEEKRIRTGLIFFLLAVIAHAQIAYDQKLESLYKHTVPLMQTGELDKKITKKNILLLDTRSSEEFGTSHIAGASFIDYERFDIDVLENVDKDTEIVVYCTVGYRSERIGEKLKAEGFKNVYNLYGGIFQWANEERPLVNSKGHKTDSVHTSSKQWAVWLQKGTKVYP